MAVILEIIDASVITEAKASKATREYHEILQVYKTMVLSELRALVGDRNQPSH